MKYRGPLSAALTIALFGGAITIAANPVMADESLSKNCLER